MKILKPISSAILNLSFDDLTQSSYVRIVMRLKYFNLPAARL